MTSEELLGLLGGEPRSTTRRILHIAGIGCALIFIFFFAFLDSVPPCEVALAYNQLTGSINDASPYFSGRYILPPGSSFLRFPSNAIKVEFSRSKYSDAPPVMARTGRDVSDPDSGGQPVTLSFSFTVRLPPANLGKIYRTFADSYLERYQQLAAQSVSDEAQLLHPSEFWSKRALVARRIGDALAEKIKAQGFAEVTTFQLLSIEFLKQYESTIVDIQLAVQERTTQEYFQSVVALLKEIDLMEAQANKTASVIRANARAQATLITAQASTRALNHTQQRKATFYKQLSDALQLGPSELLRYLQVRAVTAVHRGSNLTVGVRSPFRRGPTKLSFNKQQH